MMNIQTAKVNFLTQKKYPKFQLKAVLFDMDGVLYDSMPNHAKAWSTAMTQFGLEMTSEEAYMHEGRTGSDTINILAQRFWKREATEEEKQKIYKGKSDEFNRCPPASIMPGAHDVLQKVKDDGLFSVLVTGSGQFSLLDKLNHNFPDSFTKEHMVTSYDVKCGKPNPEPYLTGLKRGSLQPWECIVIENAPLGIESAVAAGLFTVAVNSGPLPDTVLIDSGAHLVFPSMQSLCNEWSYVINELHR